jgi:hypothetical protein
MPDGRRNRRCGRARKYAIKRANEALTFNGDRAQRFQGIFRCWVSRFHFLNTCGSGAADSLL